MEERLGGKVGAGRWVALAVATVAMGVRVAQAGLIVMQVEATDSEGRYSPVDFGGSSVRGPSDGGAFGGVGFATLSGLRVNGQDTSEHARLVGEAFYGAASPGAGAVSEVWLLTSSDLLGKHLRPTPRRAGMRLPAPVAFPGRPRVVNASFAGSSGWTSLDADLLKRADVLVSRDGTFMAAGAVSGRTGSFQGATLIWAGKNVLAVRGDSRESTFDPSGNEVGKRYAEIWGDGTASIATGRVSGMAAALISEATAEGKPRATRPAAVRAMLMAGADRSAVAKESGSPAWRAEQANGLDTDLGAGLADMDGARQVLDGTALRGVRMAGTARARTIAGPWYLDAVPPRKRGSVVQAISGADGAGSVGLTSVLTVRPGQTWGGLFRLEGDATNLSAALTWDTLARNGAVGDLRLELRGVTLTPRGDALLSGTSLLSVHAPGDNVRFAALDAAIPAGLYAWTIVNPGRETLTPVLAFRFGVAAAPSAIASSMATMKETGTVAPIAGSTVVPEPAHLASLLAAAPLLARRRRTP